MFLIQIFFFLFVSTAEAITPPAVDKAVLGTIKNNADVAIIIGNENYFRLPQAIFAQNDAESVYDYFVKTQRFHKRKTILLRNAKKENIEKEVAKLAKKVSKKGTIWLYFSGHGVADRNGNRFILPVDADPKQPLANAIDVNLLFETLGKKASRVVIILDTSFGNIGRDGLPIFDNQTPFEPYAVSFTDPNKLLWTADENQGATTAYLQAQHSIFTYLLLGGLQGWADGQLSNEPNGDVSFAELQHFVHNTMTQLGDPSIPSVFPMPEMETFILRKSTELEAIPNSAILEEMSIAIRMRNFSNQSELLRAEAITVWNDVLFDVQKGGQQGEDALKRYLERYERTEISATWLLHIPQVSQARIILKNYANAGNIIPFDPQICKDLFRLEGDAMMGALGKEQIACLEAELRLERIQTKRSMLSTLLINNDLHAKNWKSWEYRMRHHLSSIDRSQPDHSFSFAVFLKQKGPEYYKEGLKWSNYTMETRTSWGEGDQFIVKSNRLFQLRAELSMELWIQAEAQYAEERTAELDQISMEARGLARDLAKEWHDYAQKTNRDSDRPFKMCMSATTEPSFCND